MPPEPPEERTRVLVVDDEPVLAGTLRTYLEHAGFEVATCGDGLDAVELVRQWSPAVVVLDLGLPRVDGVEVCRRLRTFTDCYVLMLTARTDEVDVLIGLSVGADDYMTKPFSARELVARVQVLLRRPRASLPAPSAPRRVGPLTLDPDARAVRMDGVATELTRTEFDLLEALIEHPGRVLTRGQLTERVWGEGWVGDDHLVDVHIANLRKKLGEDPQAPRVLHTVRGVGYRVSPHR